MSEEQNIVEEYMKAFKGSKEEQIFESIYNQAIDHAIEVVMHCRMLTPIDKYNIEYHNIISNLKQLKKQPTPTCSICSRIIEEEAHHCEISDCPYR